VLDLYQPDVETKNPYSIASCYNGDVEPASVMSMLLGAEGRLPSDMDGRHEHGCKVLVVEPDRMQTNLTASDYLAEGTCGHGPDKTDTRSQETDALSRVESIHSSS
jgi:hypothetical protein